MLRIKSDFITADLVAEELLVSGRLTLSDDNPNSSILFNTALRETTFKLYIVFQIRGSVVILLKYMIISPVFVQGFPVHETAQMTGLNYSFLPLSCA
jgi:hypothetical protein